MEYAGDELKWFDTPYGFMPDKSDYRLQASYGISQKRGEITLFAPNRGQTIKLNLYKKYTSLKSRELEKLPRFRVTTWQPS